MSRSHRAPLGAASALLFAFVFTGCSALSAAQTTSDEPTTAAVFTVDNCGTEITVDTPPQRIITIKSSTLELLLALGAGDRIVASAFSDGPLPDDLADDAAGITVLSDKLPSRESVLALEPDMVYAGWESNFSLEGVGERDELQQLGITTYVAPAACKGAQYMPNPLTFEKVFDDFKELGKLIGEESSAAALVEKQRAQLAEITPDDQERSAIWYSSGRDQPYVGAGIGAPQMIMDAAGLENVFADVQDTWTSTSWELVADANPDVLVLVDSSWNTAESKIAQLKANPVTATIDAVKYDRFLIVDFPATEAGIRNVEAVADLVDDLAKLT